MVSYLRLRMNSYASHNKLDKKQKVKYNELLSVFRESDCLLIGSESRKIAYGEVLYAFCNDHNLLCYCAPVNRYTVDDGYLVVLINEKRPIVRVPDRIMGLVIGKKGWRINEIKQDSELNVRLQKVRCDVVEW